MVFTSIIIVNWNTKELTARCLRSIYENVSPDFEIIVVDNGSTDGSAEFIRQQFPDVRLIENGENKGYARANNQGLKAAQGDPIVLMNSDAAVMSKDPVGIILKIFEDHPDIGIVGAKQLYPNGKIQSLGRQFVSVKNLVKSQLLFAAAPVFIKDSGRKMIEVDYVDGAFLAIRRQVIEKIGLLNENYYMYAEDMEWCASARDRGWKVTVLPEIEILHEHAASSLKRYRDILVYNAVNICRFIAKCEGTDEAKKAFYVLMAGMLLRIPLSLVRPGKSKLALDYLVGFKRCYGLLNHLGPILKGKEYETCGD
ncbi:glycosyltransferase family 2 protein [candidate division KSB1 bacterium]|nr:glycosyltransferase family 2 protein [candidate division KSB1 bacterium]